MFHISSGKHKLEEQNTIAHPLEWVKIQTLTPPNAGEDVDQQELSSLLVGMQHGTATLEDSSVVSDKT